MSYQALYRKWRPQQFADIVGQKAVSRTLRNAIKEDKTSHAYLFTGPRGTGKTSAAKIFAKAVNCPNQTDGEPCNHCDICQAITAGTLADVIEIDAASNNGVEEIRDIRDKVRYAPTEARNKVYIIDEVHMLSTGAFNALLKTLEEPPEHVIFILATTEVHKIPATVISRTQRFDFKRISASDLIQRMADILEQEGVTYEPEALDIIARTANGGMRDALSVLDQVLSFSEDTLTADTARQLTGTLSNEQKISYETALYQQETAQALKILRAILADGKEASRFIEEILLFTRDVMMAKEVTAKKVAELMGDYTENFSDLVEEVDFDFLYQVMQVFKDTQTEIRFSMQPAIYLEVATIRLSQRVMSTQQTKQVENQSVATQPLQQTVQALQQEVEQLKQALKQGQTISDTQTTAQSTISARPETKGQVRTNHTFEPKMGLIYQTLSQATNTDRNQIVSVWNSVVEQLPTMQKALLEQTEPVAASSTHFVVSFQYQTLCQQVAANSQIQQAVADKIHQETGHPGKMLVLTDDQWHQARQTYVKAYREGKQETLLPHDTESKAEDTPASEAAEVTSTATIATPDITSNESTADSVAETITTQEEQVANPLIDLFGKENVTITDD
ncbi:MAG: DNA polymerase III subunit gamma/tau [Aerococcus sp.]|nr:DNA polymerase III subunit gamma/tau [Aerococcus sp.]